MFQSINSTFAFTALSRVEQAMVWTTFFEAIDEGCMGAHPLYGVLAPLYAAGDYLCDAAGGHTDAAGGLQTLEPQSTLSGEAMLEGVVPPF